MKAVFGAVAFATAASAAVLPRDQCCFQIYASGGVSGLLGQLSDGQNRINGSYAPESYCYSNGGIIDAHGRGCVVTYTNDATHQFQCDEGRPPTYGFAIASNGSILYQGNDQFYACPYEYEYNVYTQWLQGQDKCRPVKLSTSGMNGTCSAAGTTGGYAAPSGQAPGYSIPAYGGSSAAGSASSYSQQTAPYAYSSYGTASVPTSGYASETVPSYSSASQPVVPGYGGGSSEVTSAVTVPASTAPAYGSSASSVETSPVESTPSVPGYGGSSEVTSQATIPSYGSASASVPAYGSSIETSQVESSASQPSAPGYPQPATSETSVPGHSASVQSTPAESSPVESTPAVPSYPAGSSSAVTEQTTAPAPTASVPEETTIMQHTTVLTSDCETTETQVSSGTTFSSVYTTQSTLTVPVESTGVPSYGVPAGNQSTSATIGTGSVPAYGASSNSVATETTPVANTQSIPGYGASTTGAASTSSVVSSSTSPATSTSATACQTSLTGSYQTPHLIVPIASSSPDTPEGTSYNATISSDHSTIMNFDIPESYADMTCSIIFLFPEQKDLETSAYTFSGSGDLVFSSCNGIATADTTYNNAPAINATLDTIAIQSGNSYVVSTGACAAGTTQSIELSSENGLSLEFFEDWNPSSLGLYITAC